MSLTQTQKIEEIETSMVKLGYLLRAVEDLTTSLNAHMAREESITESLKEDIQGVKDELKEEVKNRDRSLNDMSKQLSEEMGKLRKILGGIIVSFSILGVLADKISVSQLIDIVSFISRLFV
jgi:hypothetical protein